MEERKTQRSKVKCNFCHIFFIYGILNQNLTEQATKTIMNNNHENLVVLPYLYLSANNCFLNILLILEQESLMFLQTQKRFSLTWGMMIPTHLMNHLMVINLHYPRLLLVFSFLTLLGEYSSNCSATS